MSSVEMSNLEKTTTSVIMAAGRGSRMRGFEGNKTLLPLVSGNSSYEGTQPILIHILSSLPPGPKAVIVNHKKDDVIRATQDFDVTYCEQPELNGTGGALLSAREFLETQASDKVIITMGDVPLVKNSTYIRLIGELENCSFTVLGFSPKNKKQYGVLEIEGDRMQRIIEWKYWRTFSKERQDRLRICNSGIYASRKDDLLRNLSILASKPHTVEKEVEGNKFQFKEYFITDLVELMAMDGLPIGYVVAEDEKEVMGVDDLNALTQAQNLFNSLSKS